MQAGAGTGSRFRDDEYAHAGAATVGQALGLGLSTLDGKLVSRPVAEAHELPYADPGSLWPHEGAGHEGAAGRRGGTLGTAVGELLRSRGHDVVTVGRSSGDLRTDVTDAAEVARLLAQLDDVDAVASSAGDVPYKRVVDMAPEDYAGAYRGKVAAQIELVRQGTSQIAERAPSPSSPASWDKSRS